MAFFVLLEAAAERHAVFTPEVLRCVGHWLAVGPRSNQEASFGPVCAKFRAAGVDKTLSLALLCLPYSVSNLL